VKKILIIGANSSIASACARVWAKEQCEFFIVARDSTRLDQTAADLRALGAKSVVTHAMDATAIEEHSKMLSACVASLRQIDIALIAHGTLPNQSDCEKDISLMLSEINTNGISVIALMALLANQLETQRTGTLAVISSVAGDRGRPSNYVYGAAKAAVSTFAAGLRARLFKVGVHLIDIKPGFVDTPMTKELGLPAALVASPEKVAHLITEGITAKRNVIYTPGFWRLILLVIKAIPEFVFKRLKL
jgi:short-subunit dehydrogenase